MASLSTCHLGLWLGWQILLNLVKSLPYYKLGDLANSSGALKNCVVLFISTFKNVEINSATQFVQDS